MAHVNSDWRIEYGGKLYTIPAEGLGIGRGAENEIILPDERVSRRHAMIWKANGMLLIRDEGSTNGTFVDGVVISGAIRVGANSRIEIGGASLFARPPRESVSPLPSASPVRVSPTPTTSFVRAAPNRSLGLYIGIGAGVLVLVSVFLLFGVFLARSAERAAQIPTPLLSPTAVVISDPPAPTKSAAGTTQMAAFSVVEIQAPSSGGRAIFGSGSVVDEGGIILTNAHVVRDPETGRPYNTQDQIFVLASSVLDNPPDRMFRAQVIAVDRALDLAVLKLIANHDGSPLAKDLKLAPMPLGDSDKVQIGERIQVLGFPGLGGNTITLTEGIVSGFLENRLWIKTDTQLNSGNSGGVAINVRGELIGVPTEVRFDPELGGSIGLIRPINLAKPLLSQAK